MNLLVSKLVKSQKTEKAGPPTNPSYRTSAKISFIIAIQPFMGVNEMRIKILPLLCRLGLVLWLGSV